MKKIISILFAVMLCIFLCAGTAAAVEKEEVVYVNLDNDGSVEHVYVVNIMDLKEGQEFTDYGNYSSVKNLVTSDPLTLSGDSVSGISSTDVRLYYEGDYGAAEIPWIIQIHYYLDGTEYSPKELAGKSGYLAIYIDVTRNPNVDEYFYKHYALMMTLTLDGNTCSNISANNATVANVGFNKEITFTLMPDADSHLVVSSNVVNFSMEAITINGVRLSMDVDVDLEDTEQELRNLEDGIAEIDDNITELQNGLNAIMNGQLALDTGSMALSNGSMRISNALTELSTYNESIQEPITNVFDSALRLVNFALTPLRLIECTLGICIPELTEENFSDVLERTSCALECHGMFETKWAVDYANDMLSLIKEYKDGIYDYTNAVNAIKYGAGELSSGLNNLEIGSAQLSTGLKMAIDGTNEIKDGTSDIREKTTGMADKLNEKVDEVLEPFRGTSGTIPSFVSSKNGGVSSVQFAMHTTEIKKSDSITNQETSGVSQMNETDDENIFQRLLKLFGL